VAAAAVAGFSLSARTRREVNVSLIISVGCITRMGPKKPSAPDGTIPRGGDDGKVVLLAGAVLLVLVVAYFVL
jgi:hypothetical protein